MPGPEVLVYTGALITLGAHCVWRRWKHGDTQRLFAVALLALAQGLLLYVQKASGDYTPVWSILAIDFVTAITFYGLGKRYNKLWLWWIGAFHTFSLASSAGYSFGGESTEYLFLSVMSGLGYLSMIWIWRGKQILEWLDQGVDRGFIPRIFVPVLRSRSNRSSVES